MQFEWTLNELCTTCSSQPFHILNKRGYIKGKKLNTSLQSYPQTHLWNASLYISLLLNGLFNIQSMDSWNQASDDSAKTAALRL